MKWVSMERLRYVISKIEARYALRSHSHAAATASAAGFMSASDKSKLDSVAAGANNYIHPVSSGNKHIPAGGSSGQILRWSADGVAVWGADNDTTYLAATQTNDGLLSANDKKKLDEMPISGIFGEEF